MDIRQFIDPIEEEVMERSDEIIEAIVARHQAQREIESDEEVEEQVSIIPDSEALKAIRVLRSYEEQQLEGDSDFGRVLRVQERVYLARRTAGLPQGTLRNWLNNANYI